MNTKKKTEHPDTHFQIMDLIYKNPEISQRFLAKETGISLGSIHYCLKALIQKGWVKAENFKSRPDKSAYMYLLTPDGIIQKSNLAFEFLRRKKKEYDELRHEIDKLTKELKNHSKIR